MGKQRRIVTRDNGDQYILQGYVVGTWYLIPFVPHWNGGVRTDDLWKQYWSPHYAKKETWIPIDKVIWSEWDITKEQYLKEKFESEISNREILAKFHASF